MPASPCYRPVHIKPVTGYLDTRSTPDEVPFGGYRWAQNVQVTQKYKLCRMNGWQKLQASISDYNNQDLHDQLFDNTRQPVQFLYQAETPSGFSKLFAGTQNRLYAKNNATGNWKIISDLLGGTPIVGCQDKVRWSAGVVGQTIVFSNAIDELMYHVIDQPSEDNDQSVSTVRDFDTLNITRASLVYSWNDFIILFNVIQDGGRFSDRIIWSDYQQPLSFTEDVGVSLAGQKDLGAGETILGVAPVKDSLFIYTTRGVWEMQAAGGENVFTFAKRYSPDKVGSRCLAYPNTLVSDGDDNYYFATDGIYQYNTFLSRPKLVDWIHRASSIIFDRLDKAKCNVHHGAYNSETRSIWWSWANEGDNCPEQSLVINLEFPFSTYVDAGFTAFVNYSPDTNISLRDKLLEWCVCTDAEMVTYGDAFDKEGGFCRSQTPPACPDPPVNFYSASALTEGEITVEDWTLADADSNSLFARLVDADGVPLKILDLCGDEFRSDECNAAIRFVMSSSADYCLKEVADVYFRERCTGLTGCGTYVKEGYKTLLRSGPIDLKLPDDDKIVSRFAIELYPGLQTVPSQLILKIGVAAQALDSNEINQGRQVILWEQQDAKDLEYQGEATEAQHRADNTRPGTEMEWALYLATRFIYFELQIVNPKANPPDTGGACCLSRYTFDAKAEPRCY